MIAFWLISLAAGDEVSATMRGGIPDAAYVARYTPEARAAAAQTVLHLVTPPRLGAAISLTPDQAYADTDTAALNVWKPSFVLGTREGGEIGLNFWGLHTGGHINIAFTPAQAGPRLLDCRLLTAGAVTYKIYPAGASTPVVEAQAAPVDHHLMLEVPADTAGKPVLVELWPAPETAVIGFFGCDLSAIE